jgi:HPt (histidine-containing phosphotransfer) domain-containing protein
MPCPLRGAELSTSREWAPAARLRAWIGRVQEARAARIARLNEAASMPELLERLGQRYLARAHRQGLRLALDVDAALETDLIGPYPSLARVLGALIEYAIDHAQGDTVSLHVDVTGDEPGHQTVHFAVDFLPACGTANAGPATPAAWAAAGQMLEAMGGRLHIEHDGSLRAIAELRFHVPPRPPHVDVVSLRHALGSDDALHEVIVALHDALAVDVGHLDDVLARQDAQALRRWLHRVSGALGMAEATGLAALGMRLEHDMGSRSLADMEMPVRRFAMDATRALAWLRESRAETSLI